MGIKNKNIKKLLNGVMLNAYPDSCGGNFGEMVKLLKTEDFKNIFSYFYILPSMFQSDLDRGFSVISYDPDQNYISKENLKNLQELDISLKLDFVLNHLSVQSPQFQDIIKKGDNSKYVNCFIDWNKFWKGKGEIGPEGYIIPEKKFLNKLFMRKSDLPILKIPFPDGTYRFYWNTFYQKIIIRAPIANELLVIKNLGKKDTESIAATIKTAIDNNIPVQNIDFGKYNKYKNRIISFLERNCQSYLGQMDLNAESEIVWQFYRETMQKLKEYGAKIVRLDAFAYLHKEIGSSNFFNEPGTWNYLTRIKQIADKYGIILLPEIHSQYDKKIHEKLAKMGYLIYDFFFPGLIIDALETANATFLKKWIKEIIEKDFITINMLGCHDGIPVLDVKGILKEKKINNLVELIKNRGGRVKDLYGPDGKKISYYQVNATFYSALGEDDKKFILARAIQLFMPGIPQIWYLDLFFGTNDYKAADTIGHKDINRTNLSLKTINDRLKKEVVKEQLKLIKFRNTFPAFGFNSTLTINNSNSNILNLTWIKDEYKTTLIADLIKVKFEIYYSNHNEKKSRL